MINVKQKGFVSLPDNDCWKPLIYIMLHYDLCFSSYHYPIIATYTVVYIKPNIQYSRGESNFACCVHSTINSKNGKLYLKTLTTQHLSRDTVPVTNTQVLQYPLGD